METNAISLQEKIQKLIDQYTLDKKKLDDLEEQNSNLREENNQLMAQIANINNTTSGSASRIKELEEQVRTLDSKYSELQKTISGFEDIATDAIARIDSAFPDLDAKKK